ncbi:NlpC/P60 family protein [Streptomyces sp. NPDC050121]|uniref:C40 family peptidase n=1 Tax=Streptomyces sp. NPDC050121 TaxID=3365601 RepID=UPI0037B6A335
MATEADEPSRAEIQQAVNALYDRAENDTGKHNVTRAQSSGGRRSGISLTRGRGGADPSLEAVTRKWFDGARNSIGPTVPAVLPTDRMPARPVAPSAPRVPKELERAFEGSASRARLELEAPERRVPELTARAVAAPPPAAEQAPEARRAEPKALASVSRPSAAPSMTQPMPQPMRPPAAPAAPGPDAAAELSGGGGDQLPEFKIMTPGAGSALGGGERASAFPTSEFGVAKPAFSFPMPEVDPTTGTFILPDFDAMSAGPSGAPAPQSGSDTGPFAFPMPDAAAATPAAGTPMPQAGPAPHFSFPMPDAAATPDFGAPMPQAGPAPDFSFPMPDAAATPDFATGSFGFPMPDTAMAQAGPGTGSFAFPMPDAGPTTPAAGIPVVAAAPAGGGFPSSAPDAAQPPFSFPYPAADATTPATGFPMTQAGPGTDSFAFPTPDTVFAAPAASAPMPQVGFATPPAGIPVPEAALTAAAAGLWEPELVGAASVSGYPAPGVGVAAPMPGMALPVTDVMGAAMGSPAGPVLVAPAPAPAPMPAPAAAPVGTTFSATGTAYLGKADKALAFARAQIGRPCLPGATGPESYDCSSLTQAAWLAAGVSLPRSAIDQAKAFTRVGLDELRPGDLVFFHDDLSHVGLCTDGATMVHAPGPGAYIREEAILPFGEGALRGAVRPA